MHMTKKWIAGDIISVKKVPSAQIPHLVNWKKNYATLGQICCCARSTVSKMEQPKEHLKTIRKQLSQKRSSSKIARSAGTCPQKSFTIGYVDSRRTLEPGATSPSKSNRNGCASSARVDETPHQAPPGTILATTKKGCS